MTDQKQPSAAGAIERATRHFSAREALRFEVPEWADDEGRPLVVTARRLNLMEQDRLERWKSRYQGFELMAHILIRYARDENDRPLFSLDDLHALKHRVDPEVLSRVAYQITNPLDLDDVKKNS
jgi:hypothetical protein